MRRGFQSEERRWFWIVVVLALMFGGYLLFSIFLITPNTIIKDIFNFIQYKPIISEWITLKIFWFFAIFFSVKQYNKAKKLRIAQAMSFSQYKNCIIFMGNTRSKVWRHFIIRYTRKYS